MLDQNEVGLLASLQRIMQSRHPYVNNTLKRLAKAAHTRINGEKKTTS